ncbi:MAG: hypothetical protein HKM07_02060 [Chlamydiae bacterium]|nr:hypothetical protein [Chlamydiota bacterium]
MKDLNKVTVYMPMNLSTQDADKPYKPSKSDKFMFDLPADATVGDFFQALSNATGLSEAQLVAFYEEKKGQKSIVLTTANHNDKLDRYVPQNILKDGHFKVLKMHHSPKDLY